MAGQDTRVYETANQSIDEHCYDSILIGQHNSLAKGGTQKIKAKGMNQEKILLKFNPFNAEKCLYLLHIMEMYCNS